MSVSKVVSMFIGGALLAVSTPGSGQSAGVWEGSLELSTGAQLNMRYVVTATRGDLEITMQVVDGPLSAVTDVDWTDEGLDFKWGAFQCRLKRHSDAYLGDCTIEGGGTGRLALNPPVDRVSGEAAPSAGGDVLNTESLVGTGASNMYDAIRMLRPRWLRPRGALKYSRPIFVTVYLDGQPMGQVSFLENLAPDAVRDARFYNAAEATFRFGSANEGGVLAVRGRR